mmetsp:Transcript_34390/g.83212  ORF Transcript_34390/g.83212 Transcript_34390/m.83212 type:complete len:120 (-) Transcript_34390:121-480(-)
MPAPCRKETKAYRRCLKEKRSGGRQCESLARTLEACREQWRRANNLDLKFDGTRIIPNQKCKVLNEKVQHCLRWRGADEEKCSKDIAMLKQCMASTKGSVARPTVTDTIWTDHKPKDKN